MENLLPLSTRYLPTRYIANDRAENLQRIMLLSLGIVLTALLMLNLFRSSEFYLSEPYISTEEFTQENAVVRDVPIALPQEIANGSSQASSVTNTESPAAPTTATTTAHTVSNPLTEEITIHSGDSLTKILTRRDISSKEVHELQALPLAFGPLTHLRKGQKLNVSISPQHSIDKLVYPIDKSKQLIVTKENNHFEARILDGDLEGRLKVASTKLKGSLRESALHAGLSEKLASQLNNIFGDTVDVGQEVSKGAKLRVVYQEYYKKDKPFRAGEIIAAQISHGDKTIAAIGNTDSNGHIVNYYTPLGDSLKTGFLRAPVHYTKISSPFNPRRMHPILHIVRPHMGVDLAAPRGSAIVATSAGKITFIGRKGGYGNAVFIRHNNKYSTVYGHMARFVKGLKAGTYVKAGQTIGYVGMSGLATGPHVHYEFRVNGSAQNPMSAKLPSGSALSTGMLHGFKSYAQAVQKYLAE